MDGAGEEFLARATGALDQDRAAAVGDQGQDLEQPPHSGTSPDDVLECIAGLEFLLKLLDLREVLESLHTPDDVALVVFQ